MAKLPSHITESDVLANPGTSYWLRDALKASRQRDCLDALYDAEVLGELLRRRADITIDVKANQPRGLLDAK